MKFDPAIDDVCWIWEKDRGPYGSWIFSINGVRHATLERRVDGGADVTLRSNGKRRTFENDHMLARAFVTAHVRGLP